MGLILDTGILIEVSQGYALKTAKSALKSSSRRLFYVLRKRVSG